MDSEKFIVWCCDVISSHRVRAPYYNYLSPSKLSSVHPQVHRIEVNSGTVTLGRLKRKSMSNFK